MNFISFCASFVCAIHCLLVPILLAIGSVVGAEVVGNPVFEWAMLPLVVVSNGYGVFKAGYKKMNIGVLCIFVVGLVFILLGAFFHWHVATAMGCVGLLLAQLVSKFFVKKTCCTA